MKPQTNAVCSIFLAIVGVAVLGASLFAKFTGALGGPERDQGNQVSDVSFCLALVMDQSLVHILIKRSFVRTRMVAQCGFP